MPNPKKEEVTAAEVAQLMRLADFGLVSAQLARMEKDNPNLLLRLRDLFEKCKRGNLKTK